MKFTIFSFNEFNHSPSAAQAGIKATIRSVALLCTITLATFSHAATRVFYDGSEAGNTNLWSQDGSRDRCASVTSSADGMEGPYAGSRMIRCNSNGVVMWNASNAYETLAAPSFSANNEVFYRIMVRVDQNHNKTDGSAKKLFRIFGTNDTYESIRTGSGLNREGVVNNTRVPTYWGGATGDNTAISSGWHVVEYYFNRSTGAVKTWHDHVLVVDSNVGQFSGSIGEAGNFYLTSNFSDAHDAENFVYFDEIEIFSDANTGTPATGSMADASIKASVANQQTLSPPHIVDIKVN